MFDPIAGHGRANAQLMASAGLAVLCPGPADLTAAVSRLARDPAAMAGLLDAVMHDSPRSGEDDLQDLVAGTVRSTAPAAGSAGAPAPAT
jgi:hypothetical protein